MQARRLEEGQSIGTTLPPSRIRATRPCHPAVAQQQAEAVIDLTDSSSDEAAAGPSATQPAAAQAVSRSPAEPGRTPLRPANPKQGSGYARASSKPSGTVTARMAPALALLRMTAATVSLHQARKVILLIPHSPSLPGPIRDPVHMSALALCGCLFSCSPLDAGWTGEAGKGAFGVG